MKTITLIQNGAFVNRFNMQWQKEDGSIETWYHNDHDVVEGTKLVVHVEENTTNLKIHSYCLTGLVWGDKKTNFEREFKTFENVQLTISGTTLDPMSDYILS